MKIAIILMLPINNGEFFSKIEDIFKSMVHENGIFWTAVTEYVRACMI